MGNESLVTLGIAFVSAGAAIAAVWAVINQTNTARFATGVDLLFSLKARFESREYRVKRGWAVAALSGKAKLENVQGVLDFFETIGLLVRRKTLDAEMVFNMFSYWLHGYWLYARTGIEQQRTRFPARYSDLVWLCSRLENFERARYGPPREAEWAHFLEDEDNFLIGSMRDEDDAFKG